MRQSVHTLFLKLEEMERSRELRHGIVLEKLAEIKVETTKTNGRVSDIEDKRLPALERWRSRMGGVWMALAVVGTGAGVIATVAASYYASQDQTNKDRWEYHYKMEHPNQITKPDDSK